MLELMYDIPTDDTIEKVVITKDVVCGKLGPQIIRKGKKIS